MKRLSGFSLMEMMTVLLILSIVAAATAPMINKKMMTSRNVEAGAGGGGGGGCHWTPFAKGIVYNPEQNKNLTVSIGSDDADAIDNKTMLEICNKDPYNVAHLTLRNNDKGAKNQPLSLKYYTYGAMAMGHQAKSVTYATNSIAIGASSNSSGDNSIALGSSSNSSSYDTIAIGSSSNASGYKSIAIGFESSAEHSDSIAFGRHCNASGNSSIAIGDAAKTRQDDAETGQDKSSDYSIAMGYIAIAESDNSIAIGHQSLSKSNAICIGDGSAYASAIAIGSRYNSDPEDDEEEGADQSPVLAEKDSVAIGSKATTSQKSIAIGYNANARYGGIGASQNLIAIGTDSKASANNAVAIGAGAEATEENQIVLGTADSTVYIPGKLVVGPDSDFDTPCDKKGNPVDYVAHFRGNTYIGRTKQESGEGQPLGLYLPSESYWGAVNTDHEDGDSILEMNSCDRRLKNVGKAFTGGLAELKKLDLFHFTYKKDKSNTPHVGVMAQDLQKVFPDAVTKGDDGFLRIRMEDMFYALVNAVKELAGMFDKRDDRIVQLEKENKQLQKTVSDVEKENKQLQKTISNLEKQNSEILKRLAKLEKQK